MAVSLAHMDMPNILPNINTRWTTGHRSVESHVIKKAVTVRGIKVPSVKSEQRAPCITKGLVT